MFFLQFILGAAVGYGIGFAAGRLFAPASGDQMRLELRRRYEQIAAEAEEAGQAKRVELEAQFEQAKSSRPH